MRNINGFACIHRRPVMHAPYSLTYMVMYKQLEHIRTSILKENLASENFRPDGKDDSGNDAPAETYPCQEDYHCPLRNDSAATPLENFSSIAFIKISGTDSSVPRIVKRYICPPISKGHRQITP